MAVNFVCQFAWRKEAQTTNITWDGRGVRAFPGNQQPEYSSAHCAAVIQPRRVRGSRSIPSPVLGHQRAWLLVPQRLAGTEHHRSPGSPPRPGTAATLQPPRGLRLADSRWWGFLASTSWGQFLSGVFSTDASIYPSGSVSWEVPA